MCAWNPNTRFKCPVCCYVLVYVQSLLVGHSRCLIFLRQPRMFLAIPLVHLPVPLRGHFSFGGGSPEWRKTHLSQFFCVIITSPAYCFYAFKYILPTKLFRRVKKNLHSFGLKILFCLLVQCSQSGRTCRSAVTVSCCLKHSGFTTQSLRHRVLSLTHHLQSRDHHLQHRSVWKRECSSSETQVGIFSTRRGDS